MRRDRDGSPRTLRFARIARRLLLAPVLAFGLALIAALAARLLVLGAADGRVFTVERAPARSVAVVFGAAVGSQMLRDRVATGAALYRAHKVEHLLLSGDNRRRSYDEPNAMRRLAIESGVPESAIVLDYAGRRTYDSCARARAIFQLHDAILVTQAFHLPRALYLCERLGVDVVGVAADGRPFAAGRRQWGRELLASVRAVVDVNVRRPAVVGGAPIPIPPASTDDESDGSDERGGAD